MKQLTQAEVYDKIGHFLRRGDRFLKALGKTRCGNEYFSWLDSSTHFNGPRDESSIWAAVAITLYRTNRHMTKEQILRFFVHAPEYYETIAALLWDKHFSPQ